MSHGRVRMNGAAGVESGCGSGRGRQGRMLLWLVLMQAHPSFLRSVRIAVRVEHRIADNAGHLFRPEENRKG